jgi:rhodanese-related sulfurtransferase
MVANSPLPSVRAAAVADDAYLLDVREPDEWAAGHAPGAAHLPMMQVPVRMAEIPQEGDVVVVCRTGRRSAQVTAYLIDNGWSNVRNLEDGMVGWAAAGRPVARTDGGVGHVA